MSKIGVEILLRGTENREWLQKCINSLESESVNIHFGKHVEGNLNLARAQVWDRLDEEYLSFVDPDDIIEPGAFNWCKEVLDNNPELDGCYTLERQIDQNGITKYTQKPFEHDEANLRSSPVVAHHLFVFRRRIYDKVKHITLTAKYGQEWCLAVAAYLSGGLYQIPKIGYNWRIHGGGAHYHHKEQRKNLMEDVVTYIKENRCLAQSNK